MQYFSTMSSLLLFFTVLYISSFNAVITVAENPFTPKSFLIRYWNKQITNTLPKPSFLLNKASPLTATDLAIFSKLADHNSLATRLSEFCAKADLLCFPDLSPNLDKHRDNVNFTSYLNENFTNYGSGRLSSDDNFRSYGVHDNVIVNDFRRYSRDSTGHNDKFTGYGSDSNVVDQSFNGYGTTATGGSGDFVTYNEEVNVPNLRFSAYSDNSNGRKQSFTTYTEYANSGNEIFTSYGKNGNGASNEFNSYGRNANVMGSDFKHYGETGNGVNDTFASYGYGSNNPVNNFRNYGADGNAVVDAFKSYSDDSNVGEDNFETYGKSSNGAVLDFENYGKFFNDGTDKFSSYGKYSGSSTVGFKGYGVKTTFTEYNKKGVTFASYVNGSSPPMASLEGKVKKVNSKWVEPGKFFREVMLRSGSVMPMPDIRDKMPKRSFLPRAIVTKLPFSSLKVGEMKKIFHADDDSNMAAMISDSLNECERAPSQGETKRCVASIEDMIDFSTLVLGRNVTVRTTENTHGYNANITIGKVEGINGGKVTKSVSCHQSLFPYMLYYCHEVPKVRVYEADILDSTTKAKINHGVAICHLDTSTWSPGHGAFIALGSGPGKIEVCHWIFENDMTWTIAD